MIADLESQITELNSEMDELKEENNANLSVINRLKDSLQETNTRLVSWSLILFPNYVSTAPNENQVCLDSDETGGCRSPSPPCLSSTASLPSLPSSHPNNNNNLITYSRCPSLATVCFVKIIGIPNPVAPGQPHLCQLGKPTSKT